MDYINPEMRESPDWGLLYFTIEDAEGYLVIQEGFEDADELIRYLTKKLN